MKSLASVFRFWFAATRRSHGRAVGLPTSLLCLGLLGFFGATAPARADTADTASFAPPQEAGAGPVRIDPLDAARIAWITKVLGEVPRALEPTQHGHNSSASWIVTWSRGRAFYKQLPASADGALTDEAAAILRNNQEAFALGFGPEVLGVDEVRGVLLLAFVEGEVGSYAPDSIARFRGPVLRALRQLHAATASNVQLASETALQHAGCARLQLQAASVADAAQLEVLFAAAACHAYTRRLDALTAPSVRTHNDPNPHNMVLRGDVVHLIDWDSLGQGDPMQDLALYAMEHDCGVAELPALLRDYQGDEEGLVRAQLYLARLHARRYLTHVVGMPWDVAELRPERLHSYAKLLAEDAALLGYDG